MKAVFKICNMYSSKDVTKIKRAISNNEGIIACQIEKQNGEVEVVFDNYFVDADKIIESIEDAGFTVI
jgi:copper chaperone CopZ